MIRRLSTFFFLVPIILFSETCMIDSTYYATFFKKGSPPNLPIKFSNAQYAQIDGGKYFKYIYLIFDDQNVWGDVAHIVDSKTGQGFGRTYIEFTKVNDQMSKSEIVYHNIDEDELDKLQLIILNDTKVLLWDIWIMLNYSISLFL